MKRIKITLLALIAGLALAGLSSCVFECIDGSGHQQSEDRKVGSFSRISISGSYKVILKQDSSFSLNITADDNLLKYIKTTVSGDMLRIRSKHSFCNAGPIIIKLGIKNLNQLEAAGAVEVESDGTIHAGDFRLRLSGVTKVTMDLNAANVSTGGSGSTELNLKGQASSLDIDMSGDGKVHAFDFVVGSCQIESSGASASEINVLNSLSVHSSGASEVKYKGNPSNVSNSKSGASSVEKVN